LAAYLSEQSRASANSGLTTATLEVLACIAFKRRRHDSDFKAR
jgi:chromosome segregation and condensation protein ScpB